MVLANTLPAKSSAAYAATVIAPAEPPKAVVLPAFRVPPLTVLPPVYVLTPDRVSTPAALLVPE